MITFSPERQNLWQNWIDNCFFIETFGLWTKSVSEDTQKAIETHTHTRERRQKNALLGSSFFFRFRWHSSPTSQALSLSLCFWHFVLFSKIASWSTFLGYSQWSHRGQHRQIEGGRVRWTCWQEVSQRYRGLRCWYYFFFYLALFLICVFLIILSNSLDLAFWVFLILLFCSPFFFFFCFSLLYLIGDHRLCF